LQWGSAGPFVWIRRRIHAVRRALPVQWTTTPVHAVSRSGSLRLRATSFPTTQAIPGRHGHGYFFASRTESVNATAVSPTHSWAAGAIISTAADVADFYRALLCGRLLRPAWLRSMQTVAAGYGLGLGARRGSCPVKWGHEGEVAG
jgi:D-alanyl-D-alanine carboxypeptidase